MQQNSSSSTRNINSAARAFMLLLILGVISDLSPIYRLIVIREWFGSWVPVNQGVTTAAVLAILMVAASMSE